MSLFPLLSLSDLYFPSPKRGLQCYVVKLKFPTRKHVREPNNAMLGALHTNVMPFASAQKQDGEGDPLLGCLQTVGFERAEKRFT
jgi:hypothetical protein